MLSILQSIAEATLSHIINTLRPRHRIEEIISLRFDRLSPSYQLVLKIASVVAKDGASFTADIISHLIKELSIAKAEKLLKASEKKNGNNISNKSKFSPTSRTPISSSSSTPVANLYSMNVEETLKKIFGLNEFIKIVDRSSSRSFYSQNNIIPEGSCAVTKYKFKNVLIKKSIYDLMLNHQKQWSHQKVAEYLEIEALRRLSTLGRRKNSFDEDNSDSEIDDDTISNDDNDNGTNNSISGGNAESEYSFSRMKEFGLISIADWNMLGAHWRLSNNFIKAMACFYESGHLVDQQGDVETAKLLWTEGYEILCLMRKESFHLRESFTSIGLLERDDESVEKEEREEKAKMEEEMIEMYQKLISEKTDEQVHENNENKNEDISRLNDDSEKNNHVDIQIYIPGSSNSSGGEYSNIFLSESELGSESRSGSETYLLSCNMDGLLQAGP